MERSPILEKMERRYRYFPVFVALYEVLGILSLVLMCVWTGVWAGGWGWYGTSAEFNVHPVLMMLGLTFFHGNGMLVFRVMRNQNIKLLKFIHMTFMAIGAVAVVFGLIAVFGYHNWAGFSNMYSIHSWMGIAVVLFYFIQLTLGVTAFLLPCTPLSFGATLLPIHMFGGMAIYGGACATMLVGLYERVYMLLTTSYSSLGSEAVTVNILGLVMGLACIVVLYIVSKDAWRRREVHVVTHTTRTEEEHHTHGRHTPPR